MEVLVKKSMGSNQKAILKLRKIKNEKGYVSYHLTMPKAWMDEWGVVAGDYVRSRYEGDRVVIEKLE